MKAKFINKNTILIVFILLGNSTFSNNIDQLFNKLSKSESTIENNKIISQLENLKLNDSLQIELQFFKAKTLYMESDYKKSLDLFNKARVAFDKKNYTKRLLETDIFIVRILRRNEKYDEALKKILEVENQKEFFEDKSQLYFFLSVIYFDFVEIKKSLEYATLAKEEAIKNNNKTSLANIYNIFSVIYNFNEDSTKALEYSKKSLDLAIEQKNYLQVILMYNNISFLQTELGNYSESLKTLDKAKAYFKHTQNDYLFYFNSILKAKNYFKLGQNEKSLQLTNDVIDKTKELQLNEVLTIAYINKGDIFNSRKAYSKAEKYYQLGSDLAEKNDKFEALLESIEKRIEIAKKTNELEKTIELLNLKIELKEKVFNSEKDKELKYIEIRNNISKYKLESLNQKKQIELLNLENEKNNYQLVLLGCLIFGLSMFLYRQNKITKITKKNSRYLEEINSLKQAKLKEKINFTNNQVLEFAMQIQEQNNFFQKFKQKLNKLNKKTEDQKQRQELNKIIFDINNVIEINNEKIKLNIEIDNTTNDFLYKLKNKHKDLTDKEIQVLTYLRLNYQTKQIASILGLTNQTVNNYRYAIRRKMNLDKQDNLLEYLKEI